MPVLRIDHRAVGEAASVHDGKPLFKILHPLDAQDRPENLFPSHGHLFRHMIKNGRRQVESPFISRNNRISPIHNQFSALFDPFPPIQSVTNFRCPAFMIGPIPVSGS